MEYVKTFREVLTTPENVVDRFVLEKKARFQHPFSFGLIGVIVLIVVNSLLLDFGAQLQTKLASPESDPMQQLNYWIDYTNLKVSTQFLPLTMFLLFVPSLSLPGLFFFRNNIDGFYYNLILSCYAIGTAILSLILMIPFWLIDASTITNSTMNTYLPVIFVGIFVVRIYQKYFQMEGIRSWIQVASSYITGCIIFFLLKNLAVSVIGYFIFAVNRFLEIWMSA